MIIRRIRQTIGIMLILAAVTGLSGVCCFKTHAEEMMYAEEYRLLVDGEPVTAVVRIPAEETAEDAAVQDGMTDEAGMVSAERELSMGVYSNGYDHKLFLSLRDLAAALNGTAAQYDFRKDYESDTFIITTGMPYQIPEPVVVPVEEPWLQEGDYYDRDGNIRNAADELVWTPEDTQILTRPDAEYLTLYINPLQVDGSEVRYYTYQLSSLEDLYINVIDAQLMLGITVEETEKGTLNIQTGRGCDIDLTAYDEDGFFDLFNGVVLGDATTGEILYGCKENNPDAIASTSKLMTYMVLKRYMEIGRIGMDDVVTISAKTAALSQDMYGVVWMEEGQQVTVRDLLGAMLMVSSNEAALALAEYTAGSEEAFVQLMNEMAQLLNLSSARFYNPHGLPDYSDSLIASGRQNYMSCADLFRLSAAVLQKYPEITDYTAQKSMYLESFDLMAVNTNYLLYNMDNAIGLKTGTTDEAGCCLVAAVKVPAADGEHILVAAVLGAYSNFDRYQIPELLLTWGQNHLSQTPKPSVTAEK